jgi:hypothetical protein
MSPAIMSLISCVKMLKPEREKYIWQCIENLRRGVSVPQSLLVSQHAIDSFGPSGSWRGDGGSEDILYKIYKECNLMEVVIVDLEKYMSSGAPVGD